MNSSSAPAVPCAAVEIERLTCGYDGRPVLREASCRLETGYSALFVVLVLAWALLAQRDERVRPHLEAGLSTTPRLAPVAGLYD